MGGVAFGGFIIYLMYIGAALNTINGVFIVNVLLEVNMKPIPRITSYSLKKGIPPKRPEALGTVNYNAAGRITNPWRIKALRALNGLHPDVQAFIKRCKKTKNAVYDFSYFLKTYGYDVSIGCYGGQHRSVAIVEMIAAEVRALGKEVEVVHRDLKIEGEADGN